MIHEHARFDPSINHSGEHGPCANEGCQDWLANELLLLQDEEAFLKTEEKDGIPCPPGVLGQFDHDLPDAEDPLKINKARKEFPSPHLVPSKIHLPDESPLLFKPSHPNKANIGDRGNFWYPTDFEKQRRADVFGLKKVPPGQGYPAALDFVKRRHHRILDYIPADHLHSSSKISYTENQPKLVEAQYGLLHGLFDPKSKTIDLYGGSDHATLAHEIGHSVMESVMGWPKWISSHSTPADNIQHYPVIKEHIKLIDIFEAAKESNGRGMPSRYAEKDDREFYAECYAAYFLHHDEFKMRNPEMARLLENHFNQLYGIDELHMWGKLIKMGSEEDPLKINKARKPYGVLPEMHLPEQLPSLFKPSNVPSHLREHWMKPPEDRGHFWYPTDREKQRRADVFRSKKVLPGMSSQSSLTSMESGTIFRDLLPSNRDFVKRRYHRVLDYIPADHLHSFSTISYQEKQPNQSLKHGEGLGFFHPTLRAITLYGGSHKRLYEGRYGGNHATLAHEIGHAVMNTMMGKSGGQEYYSAGDVAPSSREGKEFSKLKDIYNASVESGGRGAPSKYALENEFEFYAECYTAYFLHHDEFKIRNPEMASFLEDHFNQLYGIDERRWNFVGMGGKLIKMGSEEDSEDGVIFCPPGVGIFDHDLPDAEDPLKINKAGKPLPEQSPSLFKPSNVPSYSQGQGAFDPIPASVGSMFQTSGKTKPIHLPKNGGLFWNPTDPEKNDRNNVWNSLFIESPPPEAFQGQIKILNFDPSSKRPQDTAEVSFPEDEILHERDYTRLLEFIPADHLRAISKIEMLKHAPKHFECLPCAAKHHGIPAEYIPETNAIDLYRTADHTTLVHEIGHAVHALNSRLAPYKPHFSERYYRQADTQRKNHYLQQLNQRLNDIYNDSVNSGGRGAPSRYALANLKEFYAEAYAAYFMHHDEFKIRNPEMAKLLEDHFNQLHGWHETTLLFKDPPLVKMGSEEKERSPCPPGVLGQFDHDLPDAEDSEDGVPCPPGVLGQFDHDLPDAEPQLEGDDSYKMFKAVHEILSDGITMNSIQSMLTKELAGIDLTSVPSVMVSLSKWQSDIKPIMLPDLNKSAERMFMHFKMNSDSLVTHILKFKNPLVPLENLKMCLLLSISEDN